MSNNIDGCMLLNRCLVKAIINEDPDRVSMLLKIGANPNYVFRVSGKRSCLIEETIRLRNVDLCKLLLKHGAKINTHLAHNTKFGSLQMMGLETFKPE